MAEVLERQSGERITKSNELQDYLARQNIYYEHWDTKDRAEWLTTLDRLTESDQARLLAEYDFHIRRLAAQRSYVNWDAVLMSDSAPELLMKFGAPHTHKEEEVRILAGGSFTFVIRDIEDTGYFELKVHEGDVIALPPNRPHAFKLGTGRKAFVVRLFSGKIGSVTYPYEDPQFIL